MWKFGDTMEFKCSEYGEMGFHSRETGGRGPLRPCWVAESRSVVLATRANKIPMIPVSSRSASNNAR